jgi:hypothetical protein
MSVAATAHRKNRRNEIPNSIMTPPQFGKHSAHAGALRGRFISLDEELDRLAVHRFA